MLFAGPSGVGKTVMATALCEALLGSCVTHRNFNPNPSPSPDPNPTLTLTLTLTR